METRTRIDVTYCLAPWYLRLRWWIAGIIWNWGRGCEELSIESPNLAQPLWHR
jgi:hypothetical protein